MDTKNILENIEKFPRSAPPNIGHLTAEQLKELEEVISQNNVWGKVFFKHASSGLTEAEIVGKFKKPAGDATTQSVE